MQEKYFRLKIEFTINKILYNKKLIDKNVFDKTVMKLNKLIFENNKK